MKQWLTQGVRFLLVTVSVIFLTSFTIDATDTLRGSQTALSIFTDSLVRGECPTGMSKVDTGTGAFCIDTYEVSPHEDCTVREPRSGSDTVINVADTDCSPVSAESALPWVHVTQPQALQLCAKVGKRLPSAEEWYRASLGTPTDTTACNVAGALWSTGTMSTCRSGAGVFDMVGNAWELIDGMVSDGVYGTKRLPGEGYVAVVDEVGLPLETKDEPQALYHDDYFWSDASGQYVVMRGGFYGSQEDGGIYATHAKTTPNFAGPAVGFRCAVSLGS